MLFKGNPKGALLLDTLTDPKDLSALQELIDLDIISNANGKYSLTSDGEDCLRATVNHILGDISGNPNVQRKLTPPGDRDWHVQLFIPDSAKKPNGEGG